jgi:hypothetical protein
MSGLALLVKRAESEFFPWVIESVTIEDDAQLKNMSDLLGIGKNIANSLESARKADKQPHLDAAKAVDDRYKPQQNRVLLAVSRLDSAVLAYYRKKKAEAEALLKLQADEFAAQHKAADALQVQQMQANAARATECAQTGEVFEPIPLSPLPQPEALIAKPVGRTIRGNMSATSVLVSYDYQIIDEDAVPRDLCCPDMKKIKARHHSGVKIIPGVLITPKPYTSTRLG